MSGVLMMVLLWLSDPAPIEPLVGCPTAASFDVSLINGKDPVKLSVAVRPEGSAEWKDASFSGPAQLAPSQIARLRVERPRTPAVCEYRIRGVHDGATAFEHQGRVRAPRPAGEAFNFSLLADTHLHIEPIPYEQAPHAYPGWWAKGRAQVEGIARVVMQNVAKDEPDFAIGLGDYIDLHTLGFNVPLPNEAVAERAYTDLRSVLSEWHGRLPFFAALGNWDGENGEFPEPMRALARGVRVLALANPDARTYPEGGSEEQSYFAFTWGDVLLVVLDVMGPTKQRLTLDPRQDPELAKAWTLGEAQERWLEQVLERSKAREKMLFIHHAVGGNGGDVPNSVYGRGGGRAAKVGEQAHVHELMKRTGARFFFYAHDHVFTEMEVEGIHYVCAGSAGAPWLFGKEETGYERDWKMPGHVRVGVEGDRVRITFKGVTGQTLHELTVPSPTR